MQACKHLHRKHCRSPAPMLRRISNARAEIEWSPSSFQHVEALGLDGEESAREMGQ